MLFKRKCKITFIRNGATINTDDDRLFDDESYPALNSNGRIEMQKIAKWIKNKGLKADKIYTGPALRTRQSAEIISDICECDVEITEGLRSRRVGVLSGLSFSEIEQKYPQMIDEYKKNPDNCCPEGAETTPEFNKRIENSINNIIENNLHKRLIIVTHNEIIQSAIANILEIPSRNQFKIYIPTGSATQISYFEDFASLVYSAYLPV